MVIEYVADEARSTDPEVHVYAEEALRAYMYYKIIERKSSVPANEKARARAEYYNERRKANARLSNFTKEEALKTIRKNFMQAPKVLMPINKITPRQLSPDVDSKLVPSTSFLDALNIHTGDHEQGNEGVIKNIKGTASYLHIRGP